MFDLEFRVELSKIWCTTPHFGFFFFSLTIFSRLWKKKIVKNCRKYWKCKYKQNSCIHCENSDVLCAHFFTLTAIKTFPCSFWSAQCWDHHSGPRISNRCFKTALSGLPINCNCNYCWYSSWETTFQHEIPKKASKLDTLILHKKHCMLYLTKLRGQVLGSK